MKAKVLPYLNILILYLLLSYSVFYLLNNQTILMLTREDGLFEIAGAMFFLSASILFLILFLKDKSGNEFYFFKTNKNVFFLLLAFIFFLGFGEEISWGQRIFNIQTPEILKEINVQGEITIHNISIFHRLDVDGNKKSLVGLLLNVDRLFSIFWFTYFVIMPILNRINSNVTKLFKKINLPLVPIRLGIFFIINYIISEIIELYILDNLKQSLTEVKECNIAFLLVMVSLWFFKNYYYKGKTLPR